LKKIVVVINSSFGYQDIRLRQLKEFFDGFDALCPRILKLVIQDYMQIKERWNSESDVSWIFSLKNLKELILEQIEYFPLDRYLRLFYENPMKNLRTLKLQSSTVMFENTEFMKNLPTTFPALKQFEITGWSVWGGIKNRYAWEIDEFLSILEILGDVKELSLKNCLIPFPADREPSYKYNNYPRRYNDVDEQKCLELFNKAFEIIDKRLPKETTHIELHEEYYGFWIKKKKGQSPVKYVPPSMKTWMSQTVPETQSNELSISEVISAGPEKGTILQTESGERIHLTPEMISKINDASITLQSSKRARMT